MASITKVARKNKPWLAQVRFGARNKSKTFPTKVEAQRWAAEKEIEWGRDNGQPIVRGKTLAQAFDRYAVEVSPTKKGERWEVVRLEKLKRDALAARTMDTITTDDIAAWIDRQTVSGPSVRRELELISSVFKVAVKRWRWATVNPVADVERPKKKRARNRRISEKEEAAILAALGYAEGPPAGKPKDVKSQEVAIGFLLCLETGMRQGELWQLDVSEVFLDLRYVHLDETKNGDPRDVSLSRRAVELFKYLVRDREEGRLFHCTKEYAGVLFRRAVIDAGIEDLRFHDTRHEACTRLAKKLKIWDFVRMLGWRDVNSALIYYNPTATEIAGDLD